MSASDLTRNWAGRWVAWVVRHSIAVLACSVLLTAASITVVTTQLGMNTGTSDMLSADLPFRKNSIALDEAFPQFSDNIVVVVDNANTDQVYDATAELIAELRAHPELFGEVFDPQSDDFFRRNGLLYLELDELERLTERLVEAQPFLGKLADDTSLVQLFDLLALVVSEPDDAGGQLPIDSAIRFMNAVSRTVESQLGGTPAPLAWRDVLSGDDEASAPRRVLLIQPRYDFSSLQPGTQAIEALRTLVAEQQLTQRYGVRVRLTGSLALTQEELRSVVDGLGLAGMASLALVLILLIWGLRSAPLVVSTLVTLIAGLIWTAGFATLAVGTLNLISVAFAVLFIGLSVDFGIHFALRFQEEHTVGESVDSALSRAAAKVGGALTWAAVAAAIGFFSFLPTDYRGLAELGLIAGAGMFIALFANLTLLPALISLLAVKPRAKPLTEQPRSTGTLIRYRVPVLIVTVVLALPAAYLLQRASFDFDPLNLKDPDTESVSTLFDLIDSERYSPYSITILATNLQAADALAVTVSSLDEVSSTSTFSDFVPDQQDDKADIIEGASFVLSPALSVPRTAPRAGAGALQSTQALREQLADAVASSNSTPLGTAAERLHNALAELIAEPSEVSGRLDRLAEQLLGSLANRLDELEASLLAVPFTADQIPSSIRERQIASDGRTRLEVHPSGDVHNRAELEAFVKAVRASAPQATGSPVTIYEAGNTVIRAFLQAALTTIALIGLLVLALTRDLRQIALIFAPLLLAATLTVGSTVVLGLSFNFANVIVLPLLFGLGIAGSIHMVRRESNDGRADALMRSSTPRAVTFSALTTIGSFGSIALSSHPGTSSMGVLLTIAISLTMLCTLVVLPALMYSWPSRAASAQADH